MRHFIVTAWVIGGLLFLGLVARLASAVDLNESPMMHLAMPSTMPSMKPAAEAVNQSPPAVHDDGEVAQLDALHRYAVDAVLSLTPPYAERNIETPENRRARWTTFALECADDAQADGDDHPLERTLMRIWIGHRETLLAKDPRHVGDEDGGCAHGPWQLHDDRPACGGVLPYAKRDDRATQRAVATILFRQSPAAWSLPSPDPWNGIVADRGKHGVNRPSIVEYMRAHPYAP